MPRKEQKIKNALRTLDNKKVVRHISLETADRAFFNWWQKVANVHVTNKNGELVKVPVAFFSPERWTSSRDSGVRDENGSLVLPIITLGRTAMANSQMGTAGVYFSDTKQPVTITKQLDPKSQLVKNLIKEHPKSINQALPIFEVFSFLAPTHKACTYEVRIWSSFIEEMNEITQKIDQSLDFQSVKSFRFDTPDGFYFVAFQDEEEGDESNLKDFSNAERIVKKELTFQVPVHLFASNNEKESLFQRTWTQTKLVLKQETSLTQEEFEALMAGSKR